MAENDDANDPGVLPWTQRVRQVWRAEGPRGIGRRILSRVPRSNEADEAQESYKRWVQLYDTLTDRDRQAIRERIENLNSKAIISVVMPVYDTEEVWLRRAIESVKRQLYPHWELCIADDCSSAPHVRRVLEELSHEDQRLKIVLRQENGHISAASNSALELATGEFVALLDHDDELTEHALYLVAEELSAFPEADLIYSDEDKLNANGERVSPHFKTDWNPDLLYSLNFVSHLGVYRTRILQEIGGFREGYEGSQDYDLALRVVERIPEQNIRHIPHVLYHWRELPASVGFDINAKSYAHENARRAIRSHLERTGKHAEVVPGYFIFHRPIYPLPTPAPLVSLVIAAPDFDSSAARPRTNVRDRLRLLVEGIYERTDYEPFEIIIVAAQSLATELPDCLAHLMRDPRLKVFTCDSSLSLSAIHELGFSHADGDLIGLLNNDVRITSAGWLREMISHALRPEIGAVGARILDENGFIKDAGVILGVRGGAGHAFRGLPADSEGYLFRAQVIQNYSAVSGDCLVMRRQVLAEVGGLNEENFPSAFNDVDLCLRIRKRGYRVLWTPYATVSFGRSVTENSSQKQSVEYQTGLENLRARWPSLIAADPHYNPNLGLDDENFSLGFPPRGLMPWEGPELSG